MLVQPQLSRRHPPRSRCQRDTSTSTETPELGLHRTERRVSIPKDAICSATLLGSDVDSPMFCNL